MERFYTLMDRNNKHVHYGFTFNEQLARKWADAIEATDNVKIDIYEFAPYEEINVEPVVTLKDVQQGKSFGVYTWWLITHLPEGYTTFNEFMDNYIWDDSATLIYNKAVADGAIVYERG